ncbi:MAG: hypothetical protein J7604_24985 [Sporocytophaga sp.]|uniref:hypothetical protein n=1 Tax=Sporocytophaga sp. TaxID=2231183 RepID=UPI001B2601F1|nr:hypothetical protein [Sporocytophaga sp.]MBO9703487.1 hypothetical protein [Sporocytophaga sp.]
MDYRIIKHILYIVSSFVIVIFSINEIFNGLHDHGQVGMLIGLIISPIILIPIIYKMKWWIKIILIISLILIPFPLTKFTMRFLYSFQEEGTGMANIGLDLIGCLLFFVISILIIELGLAFNKHGKWNANI